MTSLLYEKQNRKCTEPLNMVGILDYHRQRYRLGDSFLCLREILDTIILSNKANVALPTNHWINAC